MTIKRWGSKQSVRAVIARVQLLVAQGFYWALALYPSRKTQRRYAIGAQDIMKNLAFMKEILGPGNCYTVSGIRFPMAKAYDPTKQTGWELYDNVEYDFGFVSPWERVVKLPFVLAWLARQSEVFIYFGSHGFLVDEARALEYRFLKRRNKKIVAVFVGCDIRQREKAQTFFDAVEHDYMCSYCHLRCSAAEKQSRADAALSYCDAIFSSRDQPGYLWDRYLPLDGMSSPVIDVAGYEYSFDPDFSKGPIVVHAPTNATFKGTVLVRQAIARLRLEGYTFEYVELMGVPNRVVMDHLKRSHIVLNQFFGVMPGLFGVEAMATGNAVLGSSFPALNPDLPATIPIVPTVGHQIYENLRRLIVEPERIAPLALAGRRYVEQFHDRRTAGARFAAAIEEALARARGSQLRPAAFPPPDAMPQD